MRRRSRIAATVRNRRAAVNIRMMSVVFNVFYRFVIYFCNLLCGFSGIVYASLSLANNGLRNVRLEELSFFIFFPLRISHAFNQALFCHFF